MYAVIGLDLQGNLGTKKSTAQLVVYQILLFKPIVLYRFFFSIFNPINCVVVPHF